MEKSDFYLTVVPLLIIWFALSLVLFCFKPAILLATKKQIIGMFSRLVFTWLALFFLCSYFYTSITSALFPLLTYLLNHLQDEYIATLSHLNRMTKSIQINVIIAADLLPFANGTKYHQYFNMAPFLEMAMLLPSILMAWPVTHALSRVLLAFLSIPLLVLLLIINIPFQMAGSFESTFAKLSSIKNTVRPEPFYDFWLFFIAQGGNMVLIALFASFAIHLQNIYQRQQSASNALK